MDIDYTKEFPDLVVFKDAPKREPTEELPQHMPLKFVPPEFPEDGFIGKYGTRDSERLGDNNDK